MNQKPKKPSPIEPVEREAKRAALAWWKGKTVAFWLCLGLGVSTVLVMAGVSLFALRDANGHTLLEQWAIADAESGANVEMYNPKEEAKTNTYTGYKEATVDATHRTIPLVNPAENTNYAQFVVYDVDGTTLYESDLIPPDSHFEYDIYQNYSTPGQYIIGMLVTYYVPTYDGDTITGFTPCTVKVNNDNITLKVR